MSQARRNRQSNIGGGFLRLFAGTVDASPVYAGVYQFIIVAMILAAPGITGLIVTLLLRGRAFSPAAQLVLRPRARSQTDSSPN